MARIVTTNGVLQTTNGVLQTNVPTLEIDYFDDADLAEYGGETSFFQTQTSTVQDGSDALQGDSESDGSEAVLVSAEGDGLPNYPDQGDIWEWYTYLTDAGDVAVMRFAVQAVNTDPDGYRIQVNADVNEIEVAYQLSGSYSELQATTAPISNHLNEWLRCVVEWGTDGSMNVYLYDAAGYEIGRNTGANDTQWADGGTGWGAFNGASKTGTMFFDSARLVNAIDPATIIDTVDDGDISEYGGDTLDYSVVTSPIVHSSHSIECTTGVDGGTKGISSTSGLNAYPSAGDTFWVGLYHPAADHDLQAAFAVQSEAATADCYAVHSSPRSDAFNLVKWSGGAYSTQDSTSLDYTGLTDVWLHAKVTWKTDGTIEATLYDDSKTAVAGPISATLTDWSSGGFGWRILTGLASSVTAYGDFARITS